ncbi:MAG: GMC oxidoreductase [Candidatus Angelobacter sp.]
MPFDAIVIGTGFGGTIAAVQLAAQGKKVLILERGTFWRSSYPLPLTGDPFGKWAAANNMPVQYWPRPDHRKGMQDFFAALRTQFEGDGLYQYSMFKHADLLTANGVGGGSLIYSNVTIRPKNEALQRIGLGLGDAEFNAARQWMEGPPGNHASANRGWLNYIVTKIPLDKNMSADDYAKLGVDPVTMKDTDASYLLLDRARVLRAAARQVSQKLGVPMDWAPLELAVIEYDAHRGKDSDSLPAHTHCERQGRCMLGCLPQARHTLNKTLFKRVLQKPGVTLLPKSKVLFIGQSPQGYEVHYEDHFSGDGEHKSEFAPMVFLAGGVLGSTEILLRSKRDNHLAVSDMLGTKFSSNGDFGAFAYRTRNTDNTVLPVYSTRGPINLSHVTMNFNGRFIKIEDCAIPSMFAEFVSKGLEILDKSGASPNFFQLMQGIFEANPFDRLVEVPHTADPKNFQTEAEMMVDSFFFNVMSQDDATGKITLSGADGDQVDVGWEQPIAQQALWKDIETLLREFSSAMGGKYIALPGWQGILGKKKLVITHPLGGCPIGATHEEGVVNEFGEVFDPTQPAASKTVLKGLYVVDGAVIPGALAANPTFTISAQALKSVSHALAGI